MYFLDAVSISAGIINPASIVSDIIRDAIDESFFDNSNLSLIDWLFIFSPSSYFKHAC